MKTIICSYLKRLAPSVNATVFFVILFVSCRESYKGENFYHITGEYYYRIDKSEVSEYLDDPNSGCVYVINSLEERIPVSDNPKRKPVIVFTRMPDKPEASDWNELDSIAGQEL